MLLPLSFCFCSTERWDDAVFFLSSQLKREHDRLLPHLKALSEKEQAQAKIMQEKNQGLGLSQAFEFGQQFNKEWVLFSFHSSFASKL